MSAAARHLRARPGAVWRARLQCGARSNLGHGGCKLADADVGATHLLDDNVQNERREQLAETTHNDECHSLVARETSGSTHSSAASHEKWVSAPSTQRAAKVLCIVREV